KVAFPPSSARFEPSRHLSYHERVVHGLTWCARSPGCSVEVVAMPVTSRPNRARIHSPRGVWEDRGDAAPFTFQHDLAGEPLLQLEAIAELADRLPPELIEMAPGAQPEVVPDFRPATWSAGAGSAGAALLAVEERHQWMVLSNIEHDEAYRRLIEEVAHDFAECAGGTGSAERLEGYVFVT